jgi:hypothetical protein
LSNFGVQEIIFDLLSVNRAVRTIYAERMNIGLRALISIADSLQQKEGPPAMPRHHTPLPSGNVQRTKKTYLTRPLTAETARQIGIDAYYTPCRRAFDSILRALDRDVGRPLLLTLTPVTQKELDELLNNAERKPKLELYRTCVAAMPRLMPDGMSPGELIELLCRLTIHVDAELRALAMQTLQHLMHECVDRCSCSGACVHTHMSIDAMTCYTVCLRASTRTCSTHIHSCSTVLCAMFCNCCKCGAS